MKIKSKLINWYWNNFAPSLYKSIMVVLFMASILKSLGTANLLNRLSNGVFKLSLLVLVYGAFQIF